MKRLTGFICVCCIVCALSAKGLNKNYQEYILTYQELAVAEMNKHHIPASITLAQGLIESAGGRSNLARYSNNHFGIKCGKAWMGEKTYHDDDRPNECFREYEDVQESFEDHSLFLVRNPRYAPLFKLDMTDYKGWAHGLKNAGYATNPQYAHLLINLIERYELYQYDHIQPSSKKDKDNRLKGKMKSPDFKTSHQTFISNGLVYIIARYGDTWQSLSKELGIKAKKLYQFNDLYKDYVLKEGDIVYLKKKNRMAPKGNICHVIRSGESMHGISQMYGIRLKSLYKLNDMKAGSAVPEVGHILRLR